MNLFGGVYQAAGFLRTKAYFCTGQGEAPWEDIKLDAKHFSDIERIAFVGEKKWEKGMRIFCRPFTTAEIRYFDADQAAEWIRSQ